jgi:hypothetical protein
MAPRRCVGVWLCAVALAVCLAGGADAVPVKWTCEPTHYNDSNTCDCACGVWDPDCDKRGKINNLGTYVGLSTTETNPVCRGVVPDPEAGEQPMNDCWCKRTKKAPAGKLARGFPAPRPVTPTRFPTLKPTVTRPSTKSTGKPTQQPTARPSRKRRRALPRSN